jgi:hypothetical protein
MSTDDLLMWLRRGPPMTPSSCRPLQAHGAHEFKLGSCLRLSALMSVVLTFCEPAGLHEAHDFQIPLVTAGNAHTGSSLGSLLGSVASNVIMPSISVLQLTTCDQYDHAMQTSPGCAHN